jgi:hypothetical protein
MDSSSIEMMEQNTSLIKSAETMITNSLGKPIKFTSMERLTGPGGNSILYRCFAASGSEPIGTFIIKKAAGSLLSVENLNAEEGRRFLNDWAGTEFFSSLHLDNPISPYFYGGDLVQGFFVLEDLGEHRNLVGPLLHGDPVSVESGLLKYYSCLGTLHAMTAGKAGEFEVMFSARFPGQQPFAEELLEIGARMQKVQELLDQLGVLFSRELASEIEAVTGAVSQPGPFLTYIHADPCPDNLFDLDDHFRFIDFEWGHFGHALLDAVYPRMMWPSCWCANRLPEEMIARMENSYRAELIQGCPEVQEDAVWQFGLVHMCGMTLLNRLAWDLERALQEDHKRGIASIRQRTLAQLEAFIKTSMTFHRLPALCEAASSLLSQLQVRWTETPPLPMYPAFDHPLTG